MNELQSTYVDCCVTQQGEEHQWRVRSPWSVTRRRRAQWSGYRPPRPGLSTPIVNKSSHGGSSKKIQRFQPIRKAANGRIEFAPQKISKKFARRRAPEGALDASPGHPPPASFQTPPGPWQAEAHPGRTEPSFTADEPHPRPDRAPAKARPGPPAPARRASCARPFRKLFHIRRRTRATIPRRSGTDKLESRDASGGCRRFSLGQRKAILQMTQPSSDIRETSRDLYPSSCS
ncbi:hypothetical protein ACVWXN_009582 [Bradyrhizobium sp. i1.4.4]